MKCSTRQWKMHQILEIQFHAFRMSERASNNVRHACTCGQMSGLVGWAFILWTEELVEYACGTDTCVALTAPERSSKISRWCSVQASAVRDATTPRTTRRLRVQVEVQDGTCNVWANARENICKHSTNEKVCENTAERRQEEKRSGAFDYNTEVLKEFRGKTLVNGAVDARHPANDAARLHHCTDKTASFLFCHLIFKLEHKMRFVPSGLLHSNWLNAYIVVCNCV